MCKKGVADTLKIVIEHLEDGLWTWVYLEYENISSYLGRDKLIFTNVWRDEWVKKLSPLGEVWRNSILDYNDVSRLIILDPFADETLEPGHVNEGDMLIIGGILSDHPPRKRTYMFITSKLVDKGVRVYNLGPKIFPIDSAALVAYLIACGKRLSDIEIVEGLEIDICEEAKLILPFAYPVVDGRPFIHPRLVELLKSQEPLTTSSNTWLQEYLGNNLDNDLNV